MPSTSGKQAKLMAIAAHTKGGYGGVPQSVGQEFHQADKAQHRFKYAGGRAHHISGHPAASVDDGSGHDNHHLKPFRGFKK